MHRELVLGIEGGGTKTEWVCLRAESSQLIKHGVLPSANIKLITDSALEHLLGVLPREAADVGLCLAGCMTGDDHRRMRAVAEKIWPAARIFTGSDRDSGFATAFEDRDGIVVIAGTGSAVTGRHGDRIEKAAGWGQLLGDKGGGYNLAVQALRFALTSYDLEHRITPLGESILRTLGLNRLEDLVRWATTADKMSVAKLAPIVFAAARDGQAEMISAIENGAHVLADYTGAVARRLDVSAPEVRLMGGLFVNHPDYVDLYRDYLSHIVPKAHVEISGRSGAFGAAWLAMNRRAAPMPEAATAPDAPPDTHELARALTEQRNPNSEQLDQLSASEMVDLFADEETRVSDAIRHCREPLARAIDAVADTLRAGGRLFYLGAGTSGRLGVLDASEIPPTFGAPPELVQGIIAGGATALMNAVEDAEDQKEGGAFTMIERGVTSRDIVCGITASGRTPFVRGALGKAREIGARTILLTCNPARKRFDPEPDITIDLPTGPEIVTGSTRLKAGTATKLALNILSTCAMVRLGKVRGNLMVSLAATNEKLRDRATRLVSEVCGISYQAAREKLQAHNWDVRACL